MAQNVGYLTAKTSPASDEVYTPSYAVKPLLEFVSKKQTVWCPFDDENSEFVKIFTKNGNNVLFSHINENKNFFAYEPEEHYDVIISNPPFSKKDEVIKRLYELKHPYAILLPIPSLQGQKRFPYMKDCQALIFDKRINYYTTAERKEIQKGVSFGSFYLCRDFLPKDLIFKELNIKDK